MKTTKNDSTAEILKEFVFPLTIVKDLAEECGHSGFVVDSLMIKLERALQRQHESDIQAFEEMLKDELHIGGFADANNDLIVNRNRLRAELRKKLDKLK